MISRALDTLGLRFTLHEEGDSPWAGFRLGYDDFDVAVVASTAGDWLTLQARAVVQAVATTEELGLVTDFNASFWTGRIDWDETSGAYGVTTWAPLDRGGAVAEPALQIAFDLLVDAVFRVRHHPAWFTDLTPSREPRDNEQRALSLLAVLSRERESLGPTAAPTRDNEDLRRALAAAGLSFEEVHGGAVLTQRFHGVREPFVIDLMKLGPRVLLVRARPPTTRVVTSDRDTLVHLARLSQEQPAGCFVLEDGRRTSYLLAVPLASVELDEGRVRRLVARAGEAMAAQQRSPLR